MLHQRHQHVKVDDVQLNALSVKIHIRLIDLSVALRHDKACAFMNCGE